MRESKSFTATDTIRCDVAANSGGQIVFFPLDGFDYFSIAFRLVQGDGLDTTVFTIGWSFDQRNISRYDQTVLPSTGVAASTITVTVPTSDPTTGAGDVQYYAYGRIPVVAPYGGVYVSAQKGTESYASVEIFAWKE